MKKLTRKTIEKYNVHSFGKRQLELVLEAQINKIDRNGDYTLSFEKAKKLFRIKNFKPSSAFYDETRAFMLHGNLVWQIVGQKDYHFQCYGNFAIPVVSII